MKAVLVNADATTLAEQNSSTVNIHGNDQHTIDVDWTPGVSGNVLTLKLFTRIDSSMAWKQQMEWTGTTTLTKNLIVHSETAGGTDPVGLTINYNQQGEELKLVYAEDSSGGATKGTITAKISSRPSGA